MDPMCGSPRNFDKYGMPLWPPRGSVETAKPTSSSLIWDPMATRSEVVAALKGTEHYDYLVKISRDVLRRRIVTLGHDHPDTCDIRNILAYLLLKREKYEEAFVLHYQIKSSLSDRCYLIIELYHEREYQKALNFAQRIFVNRREVRGANDLIGLKFRTITAHIYFALNKYKEALKTYEDVYQKYFHHHGPDHSETLSVQRRIALILAERGKFDEALETFKDVLNKRSSSLGNDHEDVLMSEKDIAVLFIELGKYDKALDIYNYVYDIQSKRHPHNPVTLDTKCDIARVLGFKGKYKEALEALGDVFAIQKTKNYIPDVIGTMKIVAQIFVDKGAYREALNVYLKLYESRKDHNHPDTLDAERNIASVLLKLGEYSDSLEIFNTLYDKFCNILGAEHRESLAIQFNIAKILFLQGEFDRALTIFDSIYEVQERRDFLGPDHPDTLRTNLSIARVFARQGKLEEAQEIFARVLEKRMLSLNAGHPEILEIECDIAEVYRNQSQCSKSFQLYYRVYEKRVNALGAEHPNTLEVENVIGAMSKELSPPTLIAATLKNDLSEIKVCIERGDDIDIRDCDGSVALHVASRKGFVDIVKYLLSKGAIYNLKNKKGKKPVEVAEDDAVKNVFNLVDALFKALKKKNYKQVVEITEQEESILNARDISGCTPLHWAGSVGCKRTVSFLLSKGADFELVTQNGNSALHLAATRGHNEVVETLLLHVKEREPQKLSHFLNSKTAILGTTCLHIAAQNNDLLLLKILLENGASTKLQNKRGNIPFDLATGSEAKVSLLTRSFAAV